MTESANHLAIACCKGCAPLGDERLDELQAASAALLLKALADATRLQILSVIAASPDGEACSCHLPEIVERSQPTVSHHLRHLTNAGILKRQQRGKCAWFSVSHDKLNDLAVFLNSAHARPKETTHTK